MDDLVTLCIDWINEDGGQSQFQTWRRVKRRFWCKKQTNIESIRGNSNQSVSRLISTSILRRMKCIDFSPKILPCLP